MAYENPTKVLGYPSSAALATQYLAVKLSNGKIAACGAGQRALGILQSKATAADQGVDVMVEGVSRGLSGAAYAEMALLSADANGKLVTQTPGAEAVAIALEAASAGDQVKTVFVLGPISGGGLPKFEVTADAENGGANTILIHAQLKNRDGTNVAVATRYHAKSFDAGATFTDGGAGTIEVGSTTIEILGTTDATGLAELTVTDVAAETVHLTITPEGGVPEIFSLTFA